jgi:hypothetical protein
VPKTMVTGLLGHDCALHAPAAKSALSAHRHASKGFLIMLSPLDLAGCLSGFESSSWLTIA